ncbi:hypothetical protein KKA33_04415 [Patescibacteria group bacterium]|nr:hypothetical protein [Patescibacteria group bacterium]
MNNLLDKIKAAKLVGRGGAGYPTAAKWEMVKKASGQTKVVICNASEGELGVFKDFHILKKFPQDVVKGMVLAMDYLGTKQAYFNFNKKYYRRIILKLDPILKRYEAKGYRFTVYEEKPSYIGGEETALLNAIEGRRIEPRLKPPYPCDAGLFGKPTLIHNVETLFNVARVAEGKFEPNRFYCLSGPKKLNRVYYLPDSWTIEQILKKTKRYPRYDFFAQIGGGASGLVINQKQMETQKMTGAGSLQVFRSTTDPRQLLLHWFEFYAKESCGKCTPCREGSFQLYELLKRNKRVPWKKMMTIVEIMGKISFCALGKSIVIPVKSYMKNVLKKRA